MNKVFYIIGLILSSSFITVLSVGDEAISQIDNDQEYNISLNEEVLLSYVYDEFGSSYDSLRQEDINNCSRQEEIAEKSSGTDSDIDNSGHIEETLYQRLSLKLIDKVPKIHGSPEGTVSFITIVLMRFDLALKWSSCMSNAAYRRFLLWLSNGWWDQIKVQFNDKHDPNCAEDIKLLSILDEIVRYQKQTKKRKRKIGEYDLISAIQNEEINYDNSFDISEYAILAKKLTNVVSSKKQAKRSMQDEYILSYILLKYDRDLAWSEIPKASQDRINCWLKSGKWQKIYKAFRAKCDQSCEDDMMILSLLEKILDHVDSQPLQKKRKLKKTRINGALSI